jgi:hypothetical protein
MYSMTSAASDSASGSGRYLHSGLAITTIPATAARRPLVYSHGRSVGRLDTKPSMAVGISDCFAVTVSGERWVAADLAGDDLTDFFLAQWRGKPLIPGERSLQI